METCSGISILPSPSSVPENMEVVTAAAKDHKALAVANNLAYCMMPCFCKTTQGFGLEGFGLEELTQWAVRSQGRQGIVHGGKTVEVFIVDKQSRTQMSNPKFESIGRKSMTFVNQQWRRLHRESSLQMKLNSCKAEKRRKTLNFSPRVLKTTKVFVWIWHYIAQDVKT